MPGDYGGNMEEVRRDCGGGLLSIQESELMMKLIIYL
jgi:hypothetical protein